MLFILLLSFSTLVGWEIPSTASLSSDEEGNQTAVWLENQMVMVSECSSRGDWSVPAPLSSPAAFPSDPRVETSSSGEPNILWVEENAVRAMSKTSAGKWEPSIITSPKPHRGRLDDFDQPKEPLEFWINSPDHLRFKLKPPSKKTQTENLQTLSTNAIDAPSGGALTGAQIGFTKGTTAPSNGLAVSGTSYFNASSVASNLTTAPVYMINGTAATSSQYQLVLATSDASNALELSFGNSASATAGNQGMLLQSTIAGSTFNPLYLQPLGSGVGIGYSVAPPSGGLIVSGQVGVGTSSPGNKFVNISASSSTAYAVNVGGIISADDGSGEEFILALTTSMSPSTSSTMNLYGMFMNPTITLSANSFQYIGIYHSPTIVTTASNFNLTNYYGIHALAPGKLGSGVISNAYSGYFVAPTVATNNQALYADNISIGYTTTTPPTNGAIILGSVGIGVTSISAGALQVAGDITPEANKTRNLGETTLRYNTIFYVTATTGTSRLAPSKTKCSNCQKVMMRGTGTTYTLGEKADYIPVFCTDCGEQRVEAICHLPEAKREETKKPPEIKFLGFKVNQLSGNSRGIQVLFSYGNLQNSTYFSDTEHEQFLKMNKGAQLAFLKELGQREWDALEEVRLMKEECEELQEALDALSADWIGKDLK